MFFQHTAVMDLMERYLSMLPAMRYLRLDGSTTMADREERMKQFNAPNSPYFLFLLSTRAGGLGINLATADTVVLFDSDWNPTADAQAQDRAHRIGQTREVRVFRLCTVSPMEERVLARAQDKASMEALVIEAGQFHAGGGDGDKEDKQAFLAELLAQEIPEPTAASYGAASRRQVG
jgi:ATP-dependent helicase STH1/SNF2